MIIVLPVFRQEGWHSMDLCADMLIKYAPAETELEIGLPKYRKILGYLPSKKAINFDRWFNRWKVYPGHLEKLWSWRGHFHIVDHSYAHLANHLPKGSVGVYCHDLDAFRCILEPETERRPEWFQKMMEKVLEGLIRARLVFCSTDMTRKKLMELGYWKPESIQVVPYGVAEEFIAEGPRESGNYILHVGSCIPRKRIDVLLKAFNQIAKKFSGMNLIQAGGSFSGEQKRLIRDLGLGNRLSQRRNLSRVELARLYRGARCLVISSEAEGFGLPVIEGLACGTKVAASDLPTLREAGGSLACYFAPGDPAACADAIAICLADSTIPVPHNRLPEWTWARHASGIFRAYGSLGV